MMQPYVERDCVFEHDGRRFEAGGAVVTEARAIVYLTKRDGRLIVTDWHGQELAGLQVLSVRPVRNSWQSSSRVYGRFVLDGRPYSGSGYGAGCIFYARRVKAGRGGRT